jgi:hypothetical protein
MPPPEPGRTEPDALLARLSAAPGLCGRCVHRELLASARSVFLRCGLARSDARFPRYPPLPVVACAGYRETT